MTCLHEVTFAAEKICVKGRYLLLTDVTMAVARKQGKVDPRLEAENLAIVTLTKKLYGSPQTLWIFGTFMCLNVEFELKIHQ